jgi:hypothetical protein
MSYVNSFAESVEVKNPEEEEESRNEEESQQKVLQADKVGWGQTSPRSAEMKIRLSLTRADLS